MATTRDPINAQRGRGGFKAPHHGRRGQQAADDLLHFTLPPRQPPPAPRRESNKKRESPNDQRQRYIHAQYRFMLRPDRDYTANFCDANLHFKWEDILQVIVPTGSVLSNDTNALTQEGLTCPICMSEPVAPRMSSCGHVYCYPCILRYLETGESHAWRRCPICQNTMHGKDFKAVRWFDAKAAHAEAQAWSETPLPHLEGGKTLVTMRLVERPHITTLALPRSPTWPSDVVPPNSAPWSFTPDVEAFARFMLATPEYMRESYQRDLAQIEVEQRELRQLIGGSEADMMASGVFIVSARRKVEDQIRGLDAFRTPLVTAARKKAERGFASVGQSPSVPQASTSGESSSEDVDPYVDAMRGGAIPAGPRTAQPPKPRRNLNPPPPETTNSLFYQAASGQPIFLHPLETNILLTHFPATQLPLTIHVPVELAEPSSMQPSIRKRYKNLTHLPDACDLTLIQSDVSHLVPPAAFEPFKKALRDRHSRQRDKSRKEDRALQAAARRYTEATAPPPPPSFETHIRVPNDGLDFAPLPSSTTAKYATSPTASTSSAPAVEDDDRTIWGTRAVPALLIGSPTDALAAEDDDDRAEQDALWKAMEEEAAQRRVRGGKGRKNKGVTISLGGGGRR